MTRAVAQAQRTCLCAALLCALPLAAHAQAAAPPLEYRAAIVEAVSEYDAHHFEEARALFMKAHGMFPNARTLRGLGMVEFELRNYRESADYLAEALASSVRALDGELRDETERLLARARTFLGELDLSVAPAHARVRLDGEALSLTRGKPVLVPIGQHVLDVDAAGYRPEQRTLTIQGGERIDEQIVLEHAEGEVAAEDANVGAAPDQPAVQAALSPDSDGNAPWPIVVIATSSAALIAGGTLIVLALKDIDSVEHAPKGTMWTERSDAYSASKGKSIAGFALLGAGAVGLVTGLAWQLAGDEPETDADVALQLTPAGVSVRGAF